MTTTLSKSNRVSISDQDVREVEKVNITPNDSLSLLTADGRTISLSSGVKNVILQALTSIAHSGEVTISRVPEELTSNAAADILGVSRTTLLKWSKDDRLPSFKVGSHTRFKREDILQLQSERAQDQKEAFEQLRQFEWEHRNVLGD